MSKIDRLSQIDLLRGLSILVMIFVHTSAWYLSHPAAFMVWNLGQFAVPAFVFCSSYLFFKKKDSYLLDKFWQYVKKRIPRLLIPYWIYLGFYFLLLVFSQPEKLNLISIVKEATLTTSGLEVNWAVLLFVEITLLMPILNYLRERRKTLFLLYVLFTFGASGLLIFYKVPVNFRLIMWLPWSLIVLFSWYIASSEERDWTLPATLFASGFALFFLWILKQNLGLSTVFFHNKYPPSLYYLVWGIFSTTLIYLLAVKGLFNMTFLKKVISFFSIHSYSLFFIHFLVIFTILFFIGLNKFTWFSFTGTVLGGSVLLQLLLKKVSLRLSAVVRQSA